MGHVIFRTCPNCDTDIESRAIDVLLFGMYVLDAYNTYYASPGKYHVLTMTTIT